MGSAVELTKISFGLLTPTDAGLVIPATKALDQEKVTPGVGQAGL